MSRRRKFDRATIFLNGGGKCHICNVSIGVNEPWEAEHVIALEAGGEDTLANLRPAHVACHKFKTAIDHGKGAKIKRIRRKNGLDPDNRKPRRPIPSRPLENRGFDKRLTKKFSGEVVSRG